MKTKTKEKVQKSVPNLTKESVLKSLPTAAKDAVEAMQLVSTVRLGQPSYKLPTFQYVRCDC